MNSRHQCYIQRPSPESLFLGDSGENIRTRHKTVNCIQGWELSMQKDRRQKDRRQTKGSNYSSGHWSHQNTNFMSWESMSWTVESAEVCSLPRTYLNITTFICIFILTCPTQCWTINHEQLLSTWCYRGAKDQRSKLICFNYNYYKFKFWNSVKIFVYYNYNILEILHFT